MNRSITIIIALLGVIMIHSCKKASKTAAGSLRQPFIPLDLDSLMPTHYGSPYYWGFSYPDVSGVLIACKLSGTGTDTSGHVNFYNRNWEAALFANTTGNFLITAGDVSVNATPLNNVLYNTNTLERMYLNYDTSGTWNSGSLNHWIVTGSLLIPPFSVDISGSFPSFTGTLPVTVSRTSDFYLTFNSSNTINGDSAYVAIYGNGDIYSSSVVSANGGTAHISTGQFASATNGLTTFNHFPLSGPYYAGGGFILIVVYNHVIRTFGGKQFAFIRQKVTFGVFSFL